MKRYAGLMLLAPLLVLSLSGYCDKQRALVDAVNWRKINDVKKLISDGVDVNQCPYAESYLHYACRSMIWSLELVTLLLEAGANANVQSSADGSTPLHMATCAGNPKVVDLLLKAGAQVDIKDSEGNTPLHNAAFWGSIDVLAALYKAGGDLDAKNNRGETLLHKAASGGNINTVKWLIQSNAPLHAQDNEGNTPLHVAIQCYRAEIVEVLINAGADLLIRNSKGETSLLMYKDYDGLTNFKIVNVLLETAVQVNVVDNEANTPLHNAAAADNEYYMLALIAAGADLNARNHKGQTPLELLKLYYST